jgi:glucan phosphoethanolaminetransferase (alkaline phosphatase superfamily)
MILAAIVALLVQILFDLERRSGAIAGVPIAAAVFAILLIVFRGVAKVRLLKPVSAAAFHILFVIHFASCFLFDAFYEDAVHRRYSLLDADPDNVAYLFQAILPWTVVISLIVSIVFIYASAFFLHHQIRKPGLLAAAILIAGTVGAVRADRPALHAFVASDVKDYISGNPLGKPASQNLDVRDYQDASARSLPVSGKYKRVILFVMESITVKELARDCADSSCFPQKYANITHSYKNYYAANQDSRTGILSLLYSAFIPFPAYADRDVEQYEFIGKSKSFLDALHQSGYTTAFSASLSDRERVIMDMPWKKVFRLSEEEAKGGGKFVCLHPYEFEKSCEDRILFDRIMNFVSHDPRPFLMHEFVYGHSSQYNEIEKKTSSRYYSEFISDVISGLEARGLLDETLIIVTSDHGIRDRAAMTETESYHIPLLFIQKNFRRSENSAFVSPIDFRRIFAAEERGEVIPSTRKILPIMGSTGSAMTGILHGVTGLVLIKNRRFGARALETSCHDCPEASDVLPMLEQYRRAFRQIR